MVNIIVKKYEHYNHAMGKHISTASQYKEEMKRGGYVPYEEAKEIAAKANQRKEYKPSAKALEIIRTVKNSADKKGKVKLSGRTIKAMKEIGAIK